MELLDTSIPRESEEPHGVLDDRVAAEVMTAKVATVGQDWTVTQLVSFLQANDISGAPVVDAAQRLVGVVSMTDVAIYAGAYMAKDVSRFYRLAEEDTLSSSLSSQDLEIIGDALVEKIMNKDIYEVTMNAPLKRVAALMVEKRIHRVLVTYEHKLMGVVSSLGLLELELV